MHHFAFIEDKLDLKNNDAIDKLFTKHVASFVLGRINGLCWRFEFNQKNGVLVHYF